MRQLKVMNLKKSIFKKKERKKEPARKRTNERANAKRKKDTALERQISSLK